MSRTYKIHTHKAHADEHVETRSKSRKSRYRAEVRAALRDIQDLSEADEFYCAPMNHYTFSKSSTGYFYYEEEVEKSYLKEIMSIKQSMLNGHNARGRQSMPSSLAKLIIDRVIQKDSSFAGIERRVAKANFGLEKNLQQNSYYRQIHAFYLEKGLRELSVDELKALIHKHVASKGGS